MEKKFLSASLIMVSVCLFAFVSSKKLDDKKEKTAILQSVSASSEKTTSSATAFARLDSVPVYKIGGKSNLTGVTNTFIEGKEYEIVIKNSVVTEMYIDGQKIPREKILDYKSILDKHYKKYIENREQSIRDQDESMRKQKQSMRDQEESMRRQEQSIRNKPTNVTEDEMRPRPVRPMTLSGVDPKDAVDPKNALGQIQNGHTEGHSSRKMREIIDELITDGIIKNGKELYSFTLNIEEVKINGVKQASGIHKKYMEKYGKDLTSTLTLTYEVN